VENFKIKYGFYPPSFVRIQHPGDVNGDGSINDADCIAALLPYINRIAPNHNETAINPNTNNAFIFDWWDTIGRNIDYATGQDLVFWLAGLAKNKQRPLTSDGEKEVWYDFNNDQLYLPPGASSYGYLQAKGKEVPYLYVDKSSYAYGPSLPPAQGGPVFFDGFSNSDGYFNSGNFVAGQYENPDSFQIVTFGMDGLIGAPWEPDNVNESNFTTNWNNFVSGAAADNLCNFAGGRLERMLLGTND
jgi:hypothetical protein